MASDLVTLQTFPNQTLANLAKNTLEAAGIPAIANADDCGGMEPQLQLTLGVRLLVTRENEEAARAVLAEAEAEAAKSLRAEDPFEEN